jgi:hypothetical protein
MRICCANLVHYVYLYMASVPHSRYQDVVLVDTIYKTNKFNILHLYMISKILLSYLY